MVKLQLQQKASGGDPILTEVLNIVNRMLSVPKIEVFLNDIAEGHDFTECMSEVLILWSSCDKQFYGWTDRLETTPKSIWLNKLFFER
jgi:hypothetical protein